jgi:pimeloyl-ACP methyl ester carboxylesterase
MPEPKIWTDRAAEARNDGLDRIADAAMQRWFTPVFAAQQPERIAEIRRAFVASNREAYARCCEAIAAMDLGDALLRISTDTLVVAGAEDAGAPPAVAEAIRQKIANAALLVVPRAAHMMVIERASELSGWISAFLGQSDSG